METRPAVFGNLNIKNRKVGVCQELLLRGSKRCFLKDEGRPLETRFTGTGFKPVYAAVIKSYGRERYMKSQFMKLAGDHVKGEGKGTIEEVSKYD